jgi:hypothetical protein
MRERSPLITGRALIEWSIGATNGTLVLFVPVAMETLIKVCKLSLMVR